MNKQRQQIRNDGNFWGSENRPDKANLFSSHKSIEETMISGLFSGQSMPILKNSENEIKTSLFGLNWDYKCKSEPKIYEDYDF